MRGPIAPLVLLLAGCPPEREVLDPIGTWSEAPTPTGVALTSVAGAAPAHVVVRAIDDWAVAVPSPDLELSVDGATETVALDDLGYGAVRFDTPGRHVVGNMQVAAVAIVLEAPTPLDAQPSAVARERIVELLPAAGGAIGRSERAVWWIPAGGTPVQVLRVPEGRTLDGISVGHLDHDGLTDAIAWSVDTLVILRGHPYGGHGWAGAITADDRVIGGAALGDADGDGLADVTVAWTSAQRHELEVWRGDGAWGFTGAEPVRLRLAPHHLSIADNTGEGRPQLTMLDQSRFWSRFVVSRDSWALTGPELDDFDFLDRSTTASADFNGDGAAELFVFAPLAETAEREITMFDLTGEQIQFTRFAPLGGQTALADADRDARQDLWFLTRPGELFVRKFDGEEQAQRRVWTAPDWGPIATAELTGDGVPELLVAGRERWAWTWGGLGVFDGLDWWLPGEQELVFELGLSIPAIAAELDGTASTAEFVGLVEDGADVSIGVWSLFPGATPVVAPLGTLRLYADGTEPIDLAVCDDAAFVLTTAEVVRVDLSDGTPAREASHASSGTRIACGSGPGAARVAVLDGLSGNIRLFDASLDLITTQPASGVEDLALADGQLATCATEGCHVAAWDYGDGEIAVTTEGGTLRFGELGEAPGDGEIAIQDVDGDGLADLLAHAGGTVVIARSSGDGVGVEREVATTLNLDGPVTTVDISGAGTRLLVGTREGDLVVSRGYSPTPPPAR